MTQEEEIREESAKMPEIDFSKIANIDALDKEDRAIINKAKEAKKENSRREAKRKFDFTEAIAFPLPSKGKFYQDCEDEDLKNGLIKVRPMSLADEEIITNKAYLKSGTMFRILFDTCIESNIDSRELLQYDTLFIMYALRSLSYGDDYKFTVECDCGKEFEYDMNVSDISWKEIPNDVVDERTIKLPMSKYSVVMRLPRLKDDEAEAMLKMKHEDDPMYSDTAVALWSKTLDVKDRNGKSISPDDWIEFYNSLPTYDRNVINKSFENASNQPTTYVSCPKCGKAIKMNVPVSSDFFRIQ